MRSRCASSSAAPGDHEHLKSGGRLVVVALSARPEPGLASQAYVWLHRHLTVERLRELMPAETDGLDVARYDLPNLRALNFVIVGLLGRGVAASTRTDPQAKGLGEYLRAKVVDLPTRLLEGVPEAPVAPPAAPLDHLPPPPS